jgi:hypothetical protein
MLRRNFKNRYGGSGNAAEVDPGYRNKLQRKLRPQSTRRRDAAASSIIFCSDGMTFRSVIPESIFRLARSRSVANLGGVCGARKLWAGMPDYTGDCHRAAHCAEPLGSDSPYRLAIEGRAIERFGSRDKKKLPNSSLITRGISAGKRRITPSAPIRPTSFMFLYVALATQRFSGRQVPTKAPLDLTEPRSAWDMPSYFSSYRMRVLSSTLAFSWSAFWSGPPYQRELATIEKVAV